MTGTGEDRALGMLESALDIFNAHGRGMTPAEQALFSVGAAQVLAAIDVREAVRALSGSDTGQLSENLEDFATAATALAAEMRRYNDGHGF